MAGNMLLLIKNLLDDEIVSVKGIGMIIDGYYSSVNVSLTNRGKNFITEWISANEVLTY
jgi:hypothetical protein